MPPFLFDDLAALIRLIVVGVLSYAALVAILRVSGKRTLSQMNAFDFVVTVALGSTLATVLLSRDISLVEGVAAQALLVLLQLVITWSSQRSRLISRLVKSEPAAIVYRGHILHESLRRERVLEEELHAALRKHGIADVGQVDLVVLETDGTFSVVDSLAADTSAPPGVRGIPKTEG